MDKRDSSKEEEEEEGSENIEDEEEEEQIEEEEEGGMFDFDENFNETGKFTVNEASTVLKNEEEKKNNNELSIDTSKRPVNVENVNHNENDSDEFDFNIPESKEKNFEKNIKDKLDLLDLDLDSVPKEELINMLMKAEDPKIQKKQKKNFELKPKYSKPNILNSVYSSMQDMAENKDPELAEDFNVALTKILAKMMKQSNNYNSKIFDILISDREKIEEELKKVIIIFIF